MIFERESREANNMLVSSAYTVWLKPLKRKDSFDDYCKMLGLVEKQSKLSKKELETLKKRTDELAERIIRADKKRTKK